MSDQPSPFGISIKRYLKFIPILLLPLAGLMFMMSVAPYLAVSKGCEAIASHGVQKRRELALKFSLTMATILSMIIIIVLYILAPLFKFEGLEALIIGSIYGSFIIFSFLGSRS